MVNHDAGLVYLNIPKCASTSLKTYLGAKGFHYDQSGKFVKPRDYLAFTVVREPVDRYASALLQFLKDESGLLVDQVSVELRAMLVYQRPLIHDTHSIPQVEFLHPNVPCDFVLPLEGNLGALIDSLLVHRGLYAGFLGTQNESSARAKQIVLGLLTEEHKKVLSGFYAEDAVLHETSMIRWGSLSSVINHESGGFG